MYCSRGDLSRRPRDVHIYMGRMGRGRNNGQRTINPLRRRKKEKPCSLILASFWTSIKNIFIGFFRLSYRIPIFCVTWVLKGLWLAWSGSLECVTVKCQKCIAKKRELDQWNPDQDNPCVMCIDASKLAGLKETVKRNVSFFHRLFWLTIFIVLLGIACGVSFSIYKVDEENPIESVFQTFEVEIDDIPAPTVKSCPSFSFKLSKLNEAKRMLRKVNKGAKVVVSGNITWTDNEVYKLINTIDNICHAYKSVSYLLEAHNKTTSLNSQNFDSTSNESKIKDDGTDSEFLEKISTFLLEGTSSCSEMLQTSVWNGKSSEQHFSSEFTDVGGCCTFNKMPDKHVMKRKDSLLFVLNKMSNVESKRDETRWKNWSLDRHSFADKVNDDPRLLEGPLRQNVAGFPGALTYVVNTDQRNAACPMFDSVGTRIMISLPGVDADVQELSVPIPPKSEVNIKLYPVITIASKEIKKVPQDKRKCYFEDEYNLEFYKLYIQANCHRECMANYLRKKCGCSLLALPNPKGAVLCSGEDEFKCIREAESEIYKTGYKTECPWCKPNCNQMSYRTDTTVNPLRQSFINKDGEEASVSIIHVGFAESTAQAKETKYKHSYFEKIGLIGSMFETFNDISVLGVVRVIYAIVMSYLPLVWELLKYICFGLILSRCIKLGKSCLACLGIRNNISGSDMDPLEVAEARRDSLEDFANDVMPIDSPDVELENANEEIERDDDDNSPCRAIPIVLDTPECSVFVITEQPRPTPRPVWDA